jgi:transcriptional antiterminator RfaH
MARCDSDGLLAPLPEDFSAGDHIRITSGPFADFVARVDTVDPQQRLHLLLDLLGRPTKVVVEPEMATRTA